MGLSVDIRRELLAVADGKVSVWEFEQWLEPKSWSIHRDGSDDDVRLVSSIQSAFSRNDYVGVDDAAVRDELVLILNRITESLVFKPDLSVATMPNNKWSVSGGHIKIDEAAGWRDIAEDWQNIAAAISSSRWEPQPLSFAV